MDWEPAVQEAAQPWEPCFAPQETAPATVRCLLSRKPTRLKHEEVGHLQHSLRVLSRGAQHDATSGGIKAVATTQPADKEGLGRVNG